MITKLIKNIGYFGNSRIRRYYQFPGSEFRLGVGLQKTIYSQFCQERQGKKDNQRDHFKRILKLFGIGIIASISGYLIFGNDKCENKTYKTDDKAAIKKQAKHNFAVGGSWSLIDTQQNSFSSNQLQGSYYLIYFGFTKCPDICPTTLAYITSVVRLIKMSTERPLKIVFVSVDPERDTPQRLKIYVSQFSKNIIGVTGKDSNDSNLKDIMKNFKIYANRVAVKGNEKDYNVDHTTMVYLMGPNNEYLDHINPSLTQKQCAKVLLNKIVQFEGLIIDEDKCKK